MSWRAVLWLWAWLGGLAFGGGVRADDGAAEPPRYLAPAAERAALVAHLDQLRRAEHSGPNARRIALIEANLARRAQLPDDLGRRFVLVDIAGFAVSRHGPDPGQVVRHRAVMGRRDHATPAFADRIEYVVFNPAWEMTRSMAAAEILPKLRADPGYLARHGYHLLRGWRDPVRVDPETVDWQAVDPGRFPYRVIRAPLGGNPLGRVKIMFPNAHHVYIHDTPERWDFNRAERALSAGCARVEEALALVEWLLAPQGWRPAETAAVLAGGTPQRVDLAAPVPVYLVYWTVRVRADGRLERRDDLYGRDPAGAAEARVDDSGA
ncbi:hypothetical protein CCR85_08950 [Rhodothalassium salexigens]|uniref:L,D-transpeptidase family protein n=1 Tax=Rhodothalassium salexigens TaxID=1086 RepID=UPI00191283E5|nr:L,D-transpeptidase family protein [Rhodothalassium salexigens]MBK5911615.1 hypothetical protein [Rhodothalassium salexigens]MBK5920908.1 hypothetical protein [Rhodothalassium salexigens]